MRYAAEQLEMMIEEYLGGRLSGPALSDFERAMTEDAEVAEAVALQRELDGMLQRAFVPPKLPEMAGVVEQARRALGKSGGSGLRLVGADEQGMKEQRSAAPRWRWMAIAAAVVLTAAGVFRGIVGGGEDFRLVPPDQLYAFLQNGGWKPAKVCNTPAEFFALVKERLGQGLVPDVASAATSGVALLGWGYEDDYDGSPLSKKTMMLLTTVGEQRVLVLIDQARNRRALKVREGSTLRVEEREIGSLVVYEVTPLSEARVLGLLNAEGK